MRNPKDFWAGVLFVAVGTAAVAVSREHPMGTATRMGPAYFPSVLGGLLALIGAIAIVRSLMRSGESMDGLAFKHLGFVLGSTLLFAVLVRGAGLLVASALLILASAFASARFKWTPALILAVGVSAFSVLVFVKGLGLPIPAIGHWFGG